MTGNAQHPLFASRGIGTPLLIHPDKLRAVLGAIGGRLGVQAEPFTPEARHLEESEQRQAGYRTVGPVAIIELMGTTVARGGWMSAYSGIQSYTGLKQSAATALDDDAVERILIDCSTFGGEAELCGETADFLRGVNAVKPITFIAHDFIASAGMWLASAGSELIVTRSAEIGSIGVVMTHMSYEGAATEAGVAVTHIHAGAHKVDFSPWKDLSSEAKAIAQARIDDLYDQFTAAIAENRGISQDAVKATEARMFGAEDAVKLGLADRIDTFDNVLKSLTQRGTVATTGGIAMGDITTVAQLESTYPELCQQMKAAARAEGENAGLELADTVAADAVAEDRTRVQAILDHPEAEGREKQARTLAFSDGMPVETAAAVLASGERKAEATKTGASEFEKAMAGEDPKVDAEGTDADGVPDQAASDALWAKINGKAATGAEKVIN